MTEIFEYFSDRPLHLAIAATCFATCIFFITDCQKTETKARYEYLQKTSEFNK